jgi:hypothetical protein
MITVTYGKGFELSPAVKIAALEKELFKLPQADIITEHRFYPDVYERIITIPAWTILTGAKHKTAYQVRLEKGTIAVNTDDGIKVLTAPCTFNASAGIQRAGRVFDEEVVWVDVYANIDNCVDIKVLEDRLYVVPECGLGDSRSEEQKAKIDYHLFLHQLGIEDADITKISQIEFDLIDMPDGYCVEIKPSKIQGQGLFATKSFSVGETVCPGRLNGKRTPAGRFINHAQNNNVKPEMVNDDIFTVATRNISVGDELLVDYRASMRVNFGFTMQGELL